MFSTGNYLVQDKLYVVNYLVQRETIVISWLKFTEQSSKLD